MIPVAPALCPISIREGLIAAADAWHNDPVRPRVAPSVTRRWDALLDEWMHAASLPLFIGKARDNRGHDLRHESGRSLIPTGNGPAHWSLTLALTGVTPTLDEVRGIIDRDEISVAMTFKRVEKDGAKCRRVRAMIEDPNAMGWKVAHVQDVGLGYSGPIERLPIEELGAHFKRFLSPSNMFLVPKAYAGVAETPEFVECFRVRGS